MPTRSIASFRALIGLEIHVQLATKSKVFTGVANASGALRPGDAAPEPNSAVDEQVLGLPGTLPVMNRAAVEFAIKTGLALGCRISPFTKWDRKSYYYPDLPKNYQISQYDLPLCRDGVFQFPDERGQPVRIRIRRAHLEEDAGKLLHEAPGGYPIDYSIVDLNRAGTPLLEIVTEPDFSTARQVAIFAQELQKLVQFLGVSGGQMQLGHLRFEPNINLHITDESGVVHKTAITEIKNLNSFSVLERATAYEISRQLRQWEESGSLGRKSTFGWDEKTQSTFHQRDKEEAHDYRYFPDPDLVPVVVSESWLAELKAQIPELPMQRRARYTGVLGLSAADAAALTSDRGVGDFYESALAAGGEARRVANLLINVVQKLANDRSCSIATVGLSPAQVAQVAGLIDTGAVAASSAPALFERLLERGADASAMEAARELQLLQSADMEAIDAAIDALIAQNPKSLQDYRGGKQAALGWLVGAIMKSSKGLNPRLVQQRLKERLSQEGSEGSGGSAGST
ncbi:MAG: Asp-tRNA(Asn)/Glu-tRNA(Gln) amidotransferase subunit GatB [Phycisphaerae bacterium]|nr:Asp-tRNA(Asn)/Glu-tRNA(Gln) amidotransferase subunit GatB [Phycisphaerae bacterium]MDW8263080.1 Asp-tRNA(Asn)/Glu-tRNA(Gln) amidotransferase subunit GatB [Phycisphaerales bacterium]